MTKTLLLMQGIPGSGKSFIADLIAGATEATVCSTDDLWMDDEGNYKFDRSKLGAKHLENQRKVALAMANNDVFIIVDNTNILKKDVEPYVFLAKMFGYEVQVLRVTVNVDVAVERNNLRPEGRKVPEVTVRAMNREMETLV